MRIEIPQLHCNQCEHKWVPRFNEVRVCPKCKSYYWDLPKRIVRKEDSDVKVVEV